MKNKYFWNSTKNKLFYLFAGSNSKNKLFCPPLISELCLCIYVSHAHCAHGQSASSSSWLPTAWTVIQALTYRLSLTALPFGECSPRALSSLYPLKTVISIQLHWIGQNLKCYSQSQTLRRWGKGCTMQKRDKWRFLMVPSLESLVSYLSFNFGTLDVCIIAL